MFLQGICIVLLTGAVLACAYYLFLACVALLAPAKATLSGSQAVHTFAVLIPAHDEETGLPSTLRSCAALDYPGDKVRVYVVADNCTDRTAQVAEAGGAVVLERRDEELRGKGFALAWALDRVLADRPDAVVVLDADCRIERHALRAFDERLCAGDAVLQANDVAANPDDSGISYAVAVGNLLENDLFYAPKSQLGLAVLLRGTGMVFRRDVLERHPWQTLSVTEDTEYTLELLRAGVRVRFVPHARVLSDFPAQAGELRVQRQRWAGSLRVGKASALRLIREGIATRRGVLLDLGWTLLVISRPLVLAEAVAALLAGLLCVWLTPGTLSACLLATSLTILSLHGLYVGMGIVLLGVNGRRLSLLAGSVAAFGRLLWITLRTVLGRGKLAWAHGPRGSGEGVRE